MDRKIFTIILAIALIASFFLAVSSMSSASWYDIIFKYSTGGDWKKYIPLLIPLSGVLLLIGALNNGTYFLGRSLWAWLPLLTILYLLIGQPLIDGVTIGDVFKAIGKGYGIGMWVAIGASLIVALYNPKR